MYNDRVKVAEKEVELITKGDKMARILVSMPDEFLSKIDQVAGSEQRTRSELVREALRSYIKRTKLPSPQKALNNAKILEEILD